MRFEWRLALFLFFGGLTLTVVTFFLAAILLSSTGAYVEGGRFSHETSLAYVLLLTGIGMMIAGVLLGIASFGRRNEPPKEDRFRMPDGEAIDHPKSHAGLLLALGLLVVGMIGAFAFGPLILRWIGQV